jgi:hypothetical protein
MRSTSRFSSPNRGQLLSWLAAKERAAEACRARRILVVIEGGEELDGRNGRLTFQEFTSVLCPENHWLLLTRLSNQVLASDGIELKTALQPDDAGRLFDDLSGGGISNAVRGQILELLAGHPLALTWAGNLLRSPSEPAELLVKDWLAEEGMVTASIVSRSFSFRIRRV